MLFPKTVMLSPSRMKNLINLGLDVSDASYYINDFTEDGEINGQIQVKYITDASAEELKHGHVFYIYGVDDVYRHITNINYKIYFRDGWHRGEVYDGTYNTSNNSLNIIYETYGDVLSVIYDILVYSLENP